MDVRQTGSSPVILALGRDRRLLGLPHEVEWLGRGVSYCTTCDAPLYRDKVVAVVGGGDSAVEGALISAQHAGTTYLVYRGAELVRPQSALLARLQQRTGVQVLLGTELTELIGDEESGLRAIRLSTPSEGRDILEVDGPFVEIGADPRSQLAASLGAELNDATGEVHVDRMMRTNVDGLFAAGDLTDGSGTLKQTITAAAQGAIAALSAYEYVSAEGRRCREHERGFALGAA